MIQRGSRYGLTTALAVAFAAALAGCDGSAKVISELPDGVWQSRGYGWIWTVDDDTVRVYDIAGDYCVRSDEDVDHEDLAIWLQPGGATVEVKTDDPTYHYKFDRITKLPGVCKQDAGRSPRDVVDAVDALFTAHYPFFKERDVDWSRGVDKARDSVDSDTDEKALFEALARLMAPVDDSHVVLKARFDDDTRAVFDPGEGPTYKAHSAIARRQQVSVGDVREGWYKSYLKTGVDRQLLRGEAKKRARENIVFGMIEGIGYLNILSLEDFSEDEDEEAEVLSDTLDEAMKRFRSAEAVIIDLTVNTGGYDWLALDVANRFAEEPTLGYTKYPGDADRVEPQEVMIEPSEGPRFTGPVYVLTSDVTVSAAEVLTLALRALPNVTHVGQQTSGAFSDLLWKPLPNGWSVSLSNEVYLDAEDRVWEGRGIEPEIVIDVFDPTDPTQGHVEAVRAVMALAHQS